MRILRDPEGESGGTAVLENTTGAAPEGAVGILDDLPGDEPTADVLEIEPETPDEPDAAAEGEEGDEPATPEDTLEFWKNLAEGKIRGVDDPKPAEEAKPEAPAAAEKKAEPAPEPAKPISKGTYLSGEEYADIFEGPDKGVQTISRAMDKAIMAHLPDITQLMWRMAVQAHDEGFAAQKFYSDNPDLAVNPEVVNFVAGKIRAKNPALGRDEVFRAVRKAIPKGALAAMAKGGKENPAESAGQPPRAGSARVPAAKPKKLSELAEAFVLTGGKFPGQ